MEKEKVVLDPELKESFERLLKFLLDCYKESNWTPLKKDIQTWRSQLIELIKD